MSSRFIARAFAGSTERLRPQLSRYPPTCPRTLEAVGEIVSVEGALSLDLHGAARLKAKSRPSLLDDPLGDVNLHRFAELLHPGGRIHGIAEDVEHVAAHSNDGANDVSDVEPN